MPVRRLARLMCSLRANSRSGGIRSPACRSPDSIRLRMWLTTRIVMSVSVVVMMAPETMPECLAARAFAGVPANQFVTHRKYHCSIAVRGGISRSDLFAGVMEPGDRAIPVSQQREENMNQYCAGFPGRYGDDPGSMKRASGKIPRPFDRSAVWSLARARTAGRSKRKAPQPEPRRFPCERGVG